jgi:hypothetical protein
METWILAGRTAPFLEVADRLLRWNFTSLDVKAFWGLSIVSALVSRSTGVSLPVSLLAVCIVCGIAGIFLVYRLFGWQVASLATFLSGSWVKHVLLGGTEPLCVFLVLLAVWFLRNERYIACAAVVGAACTVRPAGAMFAVALVTVLFYRRRRIDALKCAFVIGAIGLAYAGLLYSATGSAFSNVHGYRGDWSGSFPIGIPLLAILLHAPFVSTGALVKDLIFVLLTLLCLYQLGRKMLKTPVGVGEMAEAWFVILFALFHLSYYSPFGLSEFPRFIVPLVPWLAATVYDLIPLGRGPLLMAAAVMTAYNTYTLS